MPRYRYRCNACEGVQIIFHRISDVPTQCRLCSESNKITKLLTTPNIKVTTESPEPGEVGEITQEYIEANREVLHQQKEEAKKETYEPS
tara:strand:+ start:464 stop:730 length:267 start_codon:yes stop_codon:yes gene_type:complete